MLALGLMAPGATYALSIGDIIEAAKNGNGTYVETNASVSTGGQTAGSGESVQTGDAHASSYTEINAGPDGGEVKIKIETTKNGETTTEEYSQPIEKGEGVKVEANASVNDGESESEVKVNGDVVEPAPLEAKGSLIGEISLLFTEKIPNLFKKVFSLFAWL